MAVQVLVADARVELFNVTVLPGRAGIDERGRGVVAGATVTNRKGRELGTVVTAQERRSAVSGDELVEHVHQIIGGDGALDVHRQALAREDVLDVERLELTSVPRLVELKVHGLDRVGADRRHRANVHAQSAQGLLALLIGNFQAFYSPQTLDALLVHAVSLATTVPISALPAPTGMGLREGHEPSSQLILVVGRQRDLEALCGAVLSNDATGPAFFHPERLFEHVDCSTTGVRG